MSDAADFSPVKRALLEIRQLRARLAAARPAKPNPVAIVGAAVRMPGAVADLSAFWELLAADRDAITLTPSSRWDADAIYDADPDAPGTSYSRHGAFLDGVDLFDAEFFGISPREAESMDPQHRMLLELTWEALENAAISPVSLAGSKTGVFVGLCNSDYGRMLFDDRDDIDAYTSFGMAGSIAAGRVSYFLNARGPSVVIDTACSSSLSAVHLGCNSLALGEADTIIAGAANLMLTPEATISFTKARMLAPDGQCKTFDAGADGYVRGEGAAVVVLKRLADAQAAGDPILAVIRGSAMNHDGRSAGLTAPNGPAQEAVIRTALADAQIAAADVDYVEAHGTGTSLGDPIELQALANVYAGPRSAAQRLAIGSLKTKVGHLEATAGIAGLIKIVLALQHDTLPAHRNVTTPTTLFGWDESPLEIVRGNRPWQRADRPRIAGVSAFGFSGTNVHVVVEEPPPPAAETTPASGEHLFCLSARSETALRELARRYAVEIAGSNEPLDAICRTVNAGRAHLRHRFAVRVSGTSDLVRALNAWLDGETVPGLLTGVVPDPAPGALDAPPDAGDRLTALQRRFVAGVPIDTAAIDGPGRRAGGLPTYPFERASYWRPRARAASRSGAEWTQIVAAADAQSEHGPLGWDLSSYGERWERFEALTAGHVVNLFATLGAFRAPGESHTADDLLAAYAIQPLYRDLVARWLQLLARHGILREENGTYIADRRLKRSDLSAIWADVDRLLVDDPQVLGYAHRSSPNLNAMLTGRMSPLDILFERGELEDAESGYGRSVASRYLNATVVAAVRAMLAERDPREPFRLFEAGAGTGGTTAALEPVFPQDGEYWFTDVSDGFLSRARRRFGDHRAFRFAKFDLEAPVPDDLPIGACDVVLAANVAHATRDAGVTLDRLRELLKPGGVLILVETTLYHGILDLTIAFVEGWSAFDDAYRTDRPLLDADRWAALMIERGFAEAERFPRAGTPADVIGEHVIIARNGAAVSGARAVRSGSFARTDDGTGERARARIPAPALDGLSAAEQRERLRTFVAACVADVLRLDDAQAIGLRERFTDLGMDSLMALQLKSAIGVPLGIDDQLAATVAFDSGTIEELAEQLLALLAPSAPPETARAATTSPGAISAGELAAFSDAEVEAMLAERLRANSKLVGPK